MEKAVSKNNRRSNNYRYERKFLFKNIALEDVIDIVVHTNSFCFEEIYKKRTVNNIYFDDNNLSFYKQNISGDGTREKYRLRWYSDIFSMIKHPVLEIKKKFGEIGDKLSYTLENFEIDIKKFHVDEIYQYILQAIQKTENLKLITKYQSITPSLYNSYERRYFLSNCQKYRITLDYNMNFYNPNEPSTCHHIENEIILELKYNKEYDTDSRIITQQIHTRLSKNSKYVRGIERIGLGIG